MTKYISQPVEVDAWQYEPTNGSASTECIAVIDSAPNVVAISTLLSSVSFTTRDGASLVLSEGDWLIRRPNGAVSVLPDRIFRAKYTRLLK